MAYAPANTSDRLGKQLSALPWRPPLSHGSSHENQPCEAWGSPSSHHHAAMACPAAADMPLPPQSPRRREEDLWQLATARAKAILQQDPRQRPAHPRREGLRPAGERTTVGAAPSELQMLSRSALGMIENPLASKRRALFTHRLQVPQQRLLSQSVVHISQPFGRRTNVARDKPIGELGHPAVATSR